MIHKHWSIIRFVLIGDAVLQCLERYTGVKDARQVTLIRPVVADGFTIDRKGVAYLNRTHLKKVRMVSRRWYQRISLW